MEVFSQIKNILKKEMLLLKKDETWSLEVIDRSSFSNCNIKYNYILTVIDIFIPIFYVLKDAITTYKNNLH